jgi:mono/diheme cytochrome c family protein
MSFLMGTTLCVAASLPAGPAFVADDDDDDELVLPGLSAMYDAQIDGRKITLRRQDALPAFRLAKGESPDPRLPAAGWRVAWKGVLVVKSPGKYRFGCRTTGSAVMRVDGVEVVSVRSADGKPAAAEGKPFELTFGPRPLEIELQQNGDGAELGISWESEDFPREPLPVWAVGHLAKEGAETDLFPLGRYLVEEHSCVACHKPNAQTPLSAALGTRFGPRLTEAGARLKREWIFHWLGRPQDFRPEAVMPRLFTDDRRGEIERFAVASLLTSRGKPPEPRQFDENQTKNWPSEGKALFESIGCAVCHEAHKDGAVERPARAALKALGKKTSRDAIAQFLNNPAAIDPGGRMPALAFANGDDPWRLAFYLTDRDAAETSPRRLAAPPGEEEIRDALARLNVPSGEVVKLAARPLEQQIVELGRQVMRARRCTACHEMQAPGEDEFWKPVPAAHDFAAIAGRTEGGCLDRERVQADGGIPLFGESLDQQVVAGLPPVVASLPPVVAGLPTEPRPATEGLQAGGRPAVAPAAGSGDLRRTIVAFLKEAAIAPGTPAPSELARLLLTRFNCTGCHERNGSGGLPASLVARMLVNQSDQNAEAVSPPSLTGVAGKLLGPAIRQVLEGGTRSRPWMALQMPRFDGAQLAPLPAALAAADGDTLHNEPFRPAADEELIAAGRTLVGEKGFSCTKCHDMLGIASAGTRGPELARVAERVNYDWYLRWMTDPQRLQPGTRMPTVFFGGKSTYTHILEGAPDRQRLALWQYLLVCRNLPYPEGLHPPQKLRFPETKGVQAVRTFLPETSARAIAIRSPDGLHLAYDAQNCRLSYAWSGEFLDMRPVWDGRGGNQAGIEGAVFWTAPAGFPWEVTPSASPVPDFSKRGNDTSLGAVAPQDGKLYPSRLDFRKVYTKRDCTTFEYELDLREDRKAAFSETVSTIRRPLAVGVHRQTEALVPRGQFLWLNVSSADQPPRWTATANEAGTLDDETKVAPATAVVRVQQGGKRYVIHLRGMNSQAAWLAAKRGDRWSLILRIPSAGEPARAGVDLVILRPFDDDPQTQEKVADEAGRGEQ